MHTEKQEIFDKYALSKGFNNWDSLLYAYSRDTKYTNDDLNEQILIVCDLVQNEQQKRIADNFYAQNNIGILSDKNLIK